MSQYAGPEVGAPVLVALPAPYDGGSAVTYLVADARDRQLTLHSEVPRLDASVPAGVPCLVSWVDSDRDTSREAIVVASTASALIVDMAPERRRHPRYRRLCAVRLQVPYSPLGVVEGIAEDISAGGMRIRTAVALPADARVFVSILPVGTPPILAVAEVRGPRSGDQPTHHLASVKFTLIAPSHAARLATLLECSTADGRSLVTPPITTGMTASA